MRQLLTMIKMTTARPFLVLMFVSILSMCSGDYPCVCLYAVDTPIYSQPDSTSTVIGHLYEFDCKPQYTGTLGQSTNWDAVMYEKQVGYLQKASAVSSETCQGSIPPEDKVTTARPTTSTTSTSITSKTTTSTSTTESPSSTTLSSTPTPTTTSFTASTTPSSTSSTTETSTSLTTASSTTTSTTLTPSTFSKTSSTPSSTTTSTTTTITPTTTSTTASTTPTSSTPSSTTTSKTTTSTPSTTTPTTSTRTTMTTPTPTTTRKPTTKPTTKLITHQPVSHVTHAPQISYKCPSNVVSAAIYNGGHTRVYGSTCYEMIPHHLYHWIDAENNCRNKGGHLAYIRNMTEENHVMRFLYDFGHKHAVWIGLTDLNHENYFRWTSGDPVTFTKWLPGHTSNFVNHHIEDCVVLVPYIKPGFLGSYGVWDDIDCNIPHSWVCQYDAVPTQQWIATTKNWIASIFGRTTASHHHIHFTTKTPVFGILGNALDLIG